MNTITIKNPKLANYATLLLRIGLGVGFLSAVADRLGLWERLADRMSNGEFPHDSWITPTLSIGIYRRQ